MSKITFVGGGGGGGGVSDHGGLAGLSDDDHSQYLLMDGSRTDAGTTAMSGQFNAVSGVFNDQVSISGINVGDFLGAGAGNPVDARAVTGDITVDADDTHALGTQAAQFADIFATSGHFESGVIMTAPNGSGWRLTLDNAGILQTNGPFVL